MAAYISLARVSLRAIPPPAVSPSTRRPDGRGLVTLVMDPLWCHAILCDMVTVSAGCPSRAEPACVWSLHGHSRAAGQCCWSALSWAYLIQASLPVPYHGILLFITDEAFCRNFRKSIATPIGDLFTLRDFNRTVFAERLMPLSLYNFVYISSSITALYTAWCHRLRTAKSQIIIIIMEIYSAPLYS